MAESARWNKNIVKRKSLTITYAKGFDSSSWARVVDPALKVINDAMKQYGIDVVFSIADVPVNAHITLTTQPGNTAHGNADVLPYTVNRKTYIDKVTIRVPATPRIDPKDPKSRQVGDGVKLHILVHELVHCFGLENSDHTGGDVFSSAVQLFPGKTAADDWVQFDASSPKMPPIVFDAKTIAKIKDAWPKPPEETKAP